MSAGTGPTIPVRAASAPGRPAADPADARPVRRQGSTERPIGPGFQATSQRNPSGSAK